MYFLNALHFKQFYSSELGKRVSEELRHNLRHFWQENDDESQLALGYPIRLWQEHNIPRNLIVVMPAEQGAVCWPRKVDSNKTIVAHDHELPIPSNSMNRVVLLHALEFSANVSLLMKEIYRILVPNGRMILIAPNRMGLWARSSKTPFGYGRPFSSQEIQSLLEHTEFTLKKQRSFMFMPPSHRRMPLKIIPATELIGQLLLPMCGGIHMIEAEKQIYANIMQPMQARSRQGVKPVGAAVSKVHKTP